MDKLFDATVNANNSEDQSQSNLLAIANSFNLIRNNCTSKESQVCDYNWYLLFGKILQTFGIRLRESTLIIFLF